ncbi:MAG: PAS domain S-box protein [Geminicoccaceae bacterium]
MIRDHRHGDGHDCRHALVRGPVRGGLGLKGEDVFFAAVEKTRMPMIVTDPHQDDNPIVFANAAFLELCGYELEELIGHNCRFLQGAATSKATVARVRAAIAERRDICIEVLNYRKDGSSFWNELYISPVVDAAGELRYFFASQLDVTRRRIAEGALGPAIDERVAAELALKESETRFRAIAETMPQFVWSSLADGTIDYCNERWHRFTGMSLDASHGQGWIAALHAEDRAPALAHWQHCVTAGTDYEIEYRIREGASGRHRWFLGRATPLRDAAGRVVRWFGTCTDIDEVVAARETLQRGRAELERLVDARTHELMAANERLRAESEERERAEAALRQAQKMEAVGQLTGGVAHDFNNLLMVIMGNIETARRHLGGGGRWVPEAAVRALENAQHGAERAATLTQRLLAFSRRQPLSPRPVDVNRLVAGMSDLLRRALGETLTLTVEPAAELWLAEVDANQLEAAILNLAVNARDAMASGGRLTIETANVRLDEHYAAMHAEVSAGAYVAICVSDTGAGIPKELQARVFEPFFTTKEVGQGTGLGLSQVYGFVKQSGGHVKLYSEPGEGTTVKIYLRRLVAGGEQAESEPLPQVPPGDPAETILVVEDDRDVRRHSVETLRELGYCVLEAANAEVALAELDQHPEVRLLFTDVVLPGRNGRELAEAAQARHPALKVLFTTGYARSAIIHGGRLDPDVEVLSKPFTYAALAAKVRELLGRSRAARVAVVEDEPLVRLLMVQTLAELGFVVEEAANAGQAMALLTAGERPFDALVVDLGLPDGRGDALALDWRRRQPELPVLIASGYGDLEVDPALRAGGRLKVLSKPYDMGTLGAALAELLDPGG